MLATIDIRANLYWTDTAGALSSWIPCHSINFLIDPKHATEQCVQKAWHFRHWTRPTTWHNCRCQEISWSPYFLSTWSFYFEIFWPPVILFRNVMTPRNGMTRCIKCNCIQIKHGIKGSQIHRIRVMDTVTTLALTPYHRPLTMPRPGQFPCTITPRHWAAYTEHSDPWPFGLVTLRTSDLQPPSPCWISPDNLQEGFLVLFQKGSLYFGGSKYSVTPAFDSDVTIACGQLPSNSSAASELLAISPTLTSPGHSWLSTA